MEFLELILGRAEDKPVFVPELGARLPFALVQASEKRVFDFYWMQGHVLIHAALDRIKRSEPTDAATVTLLAPAFAQLLQTTPNEPHGGKDPNSDSLSSGLGRDLYDLALDVAGFGRQLNTALNGRLSHYGAERNEIKRADQALREGLRELASERRELFREAEDLYKRAVATDAGNSDALTWMLLGWLRWRLDGQLTESAELWNRALQERGMTKDGITAMIARLSAFASAEMGNPEEAFIKLVKLGNACSNGFLLLEAATYGFKAGHAAEAKQILSTVVTRHPILTVWAAGQEFADQGRWAA